MRGVEQRTASSSASRLFEQVRQHAGEADGVLDILRTLRCQAECPVRPVTYSAVLVGKKLE